MNVGRFIPEILRTVQALQIAECSKGSTAANWIPNQPIIAPMPQTFSELEERIVNIDKKNNGISWYLSFEEPPKKCLNENNNKTES